MAKSENLRIFNDLLAGVARIEVESPFKSVRRYRNDHRAADMVDLQKRVDPGPTLRRKIILFEALPIPLPSVNVRQSREHEGIAVRIARLAGFNPNLPSVDEWQAMRQRAQNEAEVMQQMNFGFDGMPDSIAEAINTNERVARGE